MLMVIKNASSLSFVREHRRISLCGGDLVAGCVVGLRLAQFDLYWRVFELYLARFKGLENRGFSEDTNTDQTIHDFPSKIGNENFLRPYWAVVVACALT